MSDDRKKPIKPPSANPTRALVRVVLEAAAEFVPGGSILTNLFKETHPPKANRDREDWQNAISERSNEHEARLDQHERLLKPKMESIEGLPARIVEAMARGCPDGLAETFVNLEQLAALLPGAEAADIELAIQDLVAEGLLEERERIGDYRIRVTQSFYERFDHEIMTEWGSNGTRQDAALIARLSLKINSGDSQDIFDKMEWTLRRFNPALSHLMNNNPKWSWRDQCNANFQTLGFSIGLREKAGLRRFISDVEQE